MMSKAPFEAYLEALAPFAPQAPGTDPETLALCERATESIARTALTHDELAAIVGADPAIAPVLAATVGLSQERFRTWLRSRFGTAGWVKLARHRPKALLSALDEDYALLDVLAHELSRAWTWADVLARVMSPRQRAGSSIRQGRDLEDAVEERVRALGVPYVPRTRFKGKGEKDAPADFAIPGGDGALIVVAVKGFDSTGSKLSDAAREIEEMVEVRTPNQWVFAVVDGQGWLRRQADLRRIHRLWERDLIDGMFTRAQLDAFSRALHDASRRVGLL